MNFDSSNIMDDDLKVSRKQIAISIVDKRPNSVKDVCPLCDGLIHLDITSDEQVEYFVEAVNEILDKKYNKISRRMWLKDLRGTFWNFLICVIAWYGLEQLIPGADTAALGLLVAALYGILYAGVAGMLLWRERKQEQFKSIVKKEIKKITS